MRERTDSCFLFGDVGKTIVLKKLRKYVRLHVGLIKGGLFFEKKKPLWVEIILLQP